MEVKIGLKLMVVATLQGNPITVAFGKDGTPAAGETLTANGDCSGINFFDHANHNHYGSGNGSHNKCKNRGKYNGPGA